MSQPPVQSPPLLVMKAPPRWEYATHALQMDGGIFITGNVQPQRLTEALNGYGNQGWELVSSFVTTYAHGGTHLAVLIFKRQLPG